MESMVGKAFAEVLAIAIRKWFFMFILVGALGLVLSAVMKLQIDNSFVTLGSLSLFFLGCAEAETRSMTATVEPYNRGILHYTQHARDFTWSGLYLYLFGVAAVCATLWRAYDIFL